MKSECTHNEGKSGNHQTDDCVFTSSLLLTAVPRFCCPKILSHFCNVLYAHMQGEATRVITYQSNVQPDMMRALQQTGDTARYTQVSVVKTARDLQQAVSEGDRHIEIRQHLDLTTMDPLDYDDYVDIFFALFVSSSTLSIRVRLPCPFFALNMHPPVFPEKLSCMNCAFVHGRCKARPIWHLHDVHL
jgi:hypothetical protein